MDFDSRRVTYREQEIKLTVKEFQLLTILIKNKGQVVTKELILDKVWDQSGAFVEEHTINVTLSRLRRRLSQIRQTRNLSRMFSVWVMSSESREEMFRRKREMEALSWYWRS